MTTEVLVKAGCGVGKMVLVTTIEGGKLHDAYLRDKDEGEYTVSGNVSISVVEVDPPADTLTEITPAMSKQSQELQDDVSQTIISEINDAAPIDMGQPE